jgi:hypothetical protein
VPRWEAYGKIGRRHLRQKRLATIYDYQGLIGALRVRAEALDVAGLVLDEISGLPTGYVNKLLAPIPMKYLGRISMGLLLGALGCKLVLIEDADAMARVQSRLTKRSPDLDRANGAT